MFVDNTPERQRTWRENRPVGYPVIWREPPLYGLFGFPHQAGWRVVHDLLPEGSYPYASNEEKEVTAWYMTQAPRTHCSNFETFILADNAQDEIPYDPAWLDGLNLQYQVSVNGRPSLRIYGRRPVDRAPTYEAVGRSRWLTPIQAAPPSRNGAYPVHITLGEQVQLLGYDLDETQAAPGGQIVVTLYWRAESLFDRNFQVFVHLYDGELRAQDDGAPECAANPTTRWEPGQIIVDPHVLAISADVPVGDAALFVGMYDLLTQARLEVPGAPDDAIYLTDIHLGIPP